MNVKSCGGHLVYHIDKVLGIVPRELSDPPDLIAIREDCSNQRDAAVYGKGITNQLFPRWMFAGCKKIVDSTNV